ncbi:hypothetical protein LUR56_01210 [Streptomyces sp. MT29]|nr:hypothetical protein [Streptomyces sp. MT29]
MTAPNPAAQAAVITRAQEDAGVGPEQISYVEAHGTGTALGDPIEVTGLRTAFERAGAPEHADRQHCGLGTVKTNVGHLETAAGIAGLIKVLLALRHGVLPPTLHVERVNPGVRLSGSSFHLVTSVRPWQRPTDPATGSPAPRRAGVSSFGFGGMNAHIVVEEPPATEPDTTPDAAAPHLFVLSARTPERRDAHARGLMAHLDRLLTSGGPHRPTAAEVAYTLQVGRRPFAARLAVTATSLDELADALRNHLDGTPDERLHASTPAGRRPARTGRRRHRRATRPSPPGRRAEVGRPVGGRCRRRLARTASGRGTRAGDASCLSVRAHQPLAARTLTGPPAAQPHAFHLGG